MSTTAELIAEARRWYRWWGGSSAGSLVKRLADALEAAEAPAEVLNPPPEYYAENLAELHEEIAALKRELATLRVVAAAWEASQ